jgi:hypothetical protein
MPLVVTPRGCFFAGEKRKVSDKPQRKCPFCAKTYITLKPLLNHCIQCHFGETNSELSAFNAEYKASSAGAKTAKLPVQS